MELFDKAAKTGLLNKTVDLIVGDDYRLIYTAKNGEMNSVVKFDFDCQLAYKTEEYDGVRLIFDRYGLIIVSNDAASLIGFIFRRGLKVNMGPAVSQLEKLNVFFDKFYEMSEGIYS